jgi:preprotein translocase subunit SecA
MAQRDPLVEYQREGFQLFQAMLEAIKEESVSTIFANSVPQQVEGEAQGQVVVAQGLVAPQRPTELQYSAPTVDGDAKPLVEATSGGATAGTSKEPVEDAAPAPADGSGNRADRRAAKRKGRR